MIEALGRAIAPSLGHDGRPRHAGRQASLLRQFRAAVACITTARALVSVELATETAMAVYVEVPQERYRRPGWPAEGG